VHLLWQATAAGDELAVEASDMPTTESVMRCSSLPQAGHCKQRFR